VVSDFSALPWPLAETVAEPVRDDFEDRALRPQWISLRDRPEAFCTTTERPGWLTLHARGASLDDADVVFVGRRQQHLACRADVLIDASGGRGGLAVRLDEHHHYEIESDGTQVQVVARIGPLRTVVASRPAEPGRPLVLSVRIAEKQSEDARSGPDVISFSVVEPDGGSTQLAALDGRYLSTEVAGGFTGRVIGMYAAAGTVRFDWFDYVSGES
jgi:beta-xylosidase